MSLFASMPRSSSVIAIDTNVLVRVLVDDPGAPEQCKSARALLTSNGGAWVSQVVLVETVWVLESAYSFSAEQIGDVLERLQSAQALHLESPECFDAAVRLYREGHNDFSDCLILATAARRGFDLHTFDRKLAQLEGARRVGES